MKVGDVVRILDNATPMTVLAVHESTCDVAWFVHDRLMKACYPSDSLMKTKS